MYVREEILPIEKGDVAAWGYCPRIVAAYTAECPGSGIGGLCGSSHMSYGL
jgi:hypothetical protein